MWLSTLMTVGSRSPRQRGKKGGVSRPLFCSNTLPFDVMDTCLECGAELAQPPAGD